MARPASFWLNKIFEEKTSLANLSQFTPSNNTFRNMLARMNNLSRVAYWELFCWPIAVCAAALDEVFELFKLDLEALVTKSRFGGELSYINSAKEFQYGYNLEFDPVTLAWKYPVVDLASRVVGYASLEEQDNVLTLKVARFYNNDIQELDWQQLQSFIVYMGRVKPKGIALNIISIPADKMQLEYEIVFDPLVLTNSGELIGTPGVFPARQAIEDYLTAVNEGFKGAYDNDKAIDFIQKAKGVLHAYHINSVGRDHTGSTTTSFDQSYQSKAGYMKLDSDFPLDTTLVYTPGNV